MYAQPASLYSEQGQEADCGEYDGSRGAAERWSLLQRGGGVIRKSNTPLLLAACLPARLAACPACSPSVLALAHENFNSRPRYATRKLSSSMVSIGGSRGQADRAAPPALHYVDGIANAHPWEVGRLLQIFDLNHSAAALSPALDGGE